MKNTTPLLFLALAVLTGGWAFGQTNEWSYPWMATIKVVGEDGNPIAGANAAVQYTVPTPPSSDQPTYGEIKGITDTNGIFGASHTDSSLDLGIVVEKAGYYSTHSGHQLYPSGQFDQKTTQNRNFTLTVTLKKSGEPIAMYAKQAINLKLPEFAKPIGYDLMVGDWAAPYGKGVNTDIIFKQEYYEKAPNDYHSKVTVSFPKSGDGIQLFTPSDTEKGSGLRSPHEAPSDGYLPELTRETSAHPGQPSKFEYDPNRIYLFRVRTALDHDGKVVSAHYGKIYGDFMTVTYYLNPTPSDRNIEFDPKQNLIQGLQSDEQVSAP